MGEVFAINGEFPVLLLPFPVDEQSLVYRI